MTDLKGQLALITGATSGIGKACAYQLAQEGVNLILTGRREQRLLEIKAELEKKFAINVCVLNFDLSEKEGTLNLLEDYKDQLLNLDILINNAGGAHGVAPFDQSAIEDWEIMIDINIKGLLYITRFIVPLMKEKKSGHIVNLGSVAGRWVYPNGSVYCATKHAVKAISEGLRADLLGQNIRVTNIEPGMVETEFSLIRFKDEEKAKEVYKGMTPLSANDIAECILWSLKRPGHVNIQEMVIFPTEQASVYQVHRN
ncbi:MAG: NAD(P)-dependent oxidoreductase [Epsilonproteobacteria bacterium]|nr:MAG: NAD(P)-dependent oxidoreductase [Campylobacterota bacterium]RLA65915.1 MAG: NAD(P)-dependent oxidoreductase [Campylobacterota bacterium]